MLFLVKLLPPSINDSVLKEIRADIETLETKKDVNKETSNNLNEYLKVDHANTQRTMKYLLDKWLEEKKEFVSGVDKDNNNISYKFDEKIYNTSLMLNIDGDCTPFQKLVHDMPKVSLIIWCIVMMFLMQL